MACRSAASRSRCSSWLRRSTRASSLVDTAETSYVLAGYWRGFTSIPPKPSYSSEARVRYRGLSEWLAEPAVTENGRDLLESVEVNAAGARISFGFDRVDQKPSRFESRQKRLGTALFEFPSPVSLKDCVQGWVGAVQDLLVFATREQSLVEAVTVSFWDPSIAEKIAPAIRAGAPNRDWNRVDVRIVYRHGVRLAPKRHPYERILFGPAALGESASDVLGRFFDLHRQLRPVATVLFNELNLAVPSLEKRVITLMAFAEAYHRELHDDRPLSRADHPKVPQGNAGRDR